MASGPQNVSVPVARRKKLSVPGILAGGPARYFYVTDSGDGGVEFSKQCYHATVLRCSEMSVAR